MLRFLSLLVVTASLSSSAFAIPIYHPQALEKVIVATENVSESGGRPIVIFDLDDTLFSSTTRTIQILRAFIRQDKIRSEHPDEVELSSQLRARDLKYEIDESLRAAGISDESFIKKAKDYWLEKFFSNEYCAVDQPMRGASAYVNRVHEAGATVVYLTGRDKPRMQNCTERGLEKSGFPVGSGAKLLMKPNKSIEDVVFKEKVFAMIKDKGTVVAGFENEPRNINAMGAAFPDAMMIFLDTIHSNKPDTPDSKIFWVKDFALIR